MTASAILDALRIHADAAKAAEMAQYHKAARPYLGISVPDIERAVKEFRTTHAEDTWRDEAHALWTSNVHEAMVAAGKLLTKARTAQDQAFWDEICAWVPTFDAWAIADHACKAGERRVMTDLSRLDQIEQWTGADDFWTRRTALVITLPLTKLTHPKPDERAARARVLGWAASYVDDREWFIQKAISWWLRSLSKHDPDAVRTFITAHGDRMKAFARKDAVRLIS